MWNDAQIIGVCSAVVLGGANFVKTSTGFHKSGGASIANVHLMRKTVGETIGVKASGGIRTYADAIAMIDAGASRIGASASRLILAEAQ
jgi:deoxyribose-phosphate aldolase